MYKHTRFTRACTHTHTYTYTRAHSTYETSTHAHTHAHTHSIQCPMDWQWFCSEPSYSLTSATSSPPPPPPGRACSRPQPHTASLFLSLTLSRVCPRCLCIHLPLFPRLSVAFAHSRVHARARENTHKHMYIPHAHEKLISALAEVVDSSKLHVYATDNTSIEHAQPVSASHFPLFGCPRTGSGGCSHSTDVSLDVLGNFVSVM